MQLNYALRMPRQAGGRPPLLVLLHGVGGNEDGMAALAAEFDPRFLVLSLRAPFENAPGAYRWFDLKLESQGVRIDSHEAEHSRRALLQTINDAVMGFGVDPRRIYVLGFSQGATLALSLALTAPHKLRGVVAIAGRVLPEIAPLAAAQHELRHLTLLVQQGRQDPVNPLSRGHATRDLMLSLGVMLGYREYEAGHEFPPVMRTEAANFLGAQLDRLDGVPPGSMDH